jgi:4-diphosphocytidyl-2-C-methyl-D-erythritol kinase
MIMKTIDLHDDITVTIDSSKQGIDVECRDVPEENNIAYKAARAFFELTGLECGCSIIIDKHIPIMSGLGGGSSDAAVILKVLNNVFGRPLDHDRLVGLGHSIGSDVPFFMLGGTARVSGTGELIVPVPDNLNGYWLVIKPDKGIVTQEAFSTYDMAPPKNGGDITGMMEALQNGDGHLFNDKLFNALTDAAVVLVPEISALLSDLRRFTPSVFMTGSGSTCVGYFEAFDDAERAEKALSDYYAFSYIAEGLKSDGL